MSEAIVHRWYARPVFLVKDIHRALDVYTGALGFVKKWHDADGHGTACQVDRNECEIILCEDASRLFLELSRGATRAAADSDPVGRDPERYRPAGGSMEGPAWRLRHLLPAGWRGTPDPSTRPGARGHEHDAPVPPPRPCREPPARQRDGPPSGAPHPSPQVGKEGGVKNPMYNLMYSRQKQTAPAEMAKAVSCCTTIRRRRDSNPQAVARAAFRVRCLTS